MTRPEARRVYTAEEKVRLVAKTFRPGETVQGVSRRHGVADEALRRIAALYAIEAELHGQPSDVRRAGREERSRPLVEDLFGWLAEHLERVPGRGDLANAIRYALKGREGLIRCLKDGRIDLDTNAVERSIRPIALSRKNALFAGSDEGGEHWAAVASLIETCKLNGVDPQTYLADLLIHAMAKRISAQAATPAPSLASSHFWCGL